MKKLNIPLHRKMLLALLFSGAVASAQTPEQIQEITAGYNKVELKQLASQLEEQAKSDKAKAVQYAQQHNLPVSDFTEEGAYIEVQRLLEDGTLLYYTTANKDAARSTRADHLNSGGSLGLELDGKDLTAHVWDGGHPRVTHVEFKDENGEPKVSIGDATNPNLNFHAAHVVGTITASGVKEQAKGMASKSTVVAYDWNSDLSEATLAVLDGMLVSNHSYGYRANAIPDWMFGAYTGEARQWDNLLYDAPYYLTVTSAGNDGRATGYNQDPLAAGYDMLSAKSVSKNTLVVANANDANVDNDGNLISVTLDGTSSPGPTDDLRIKPDIAGNGVNVYSTLETSNAAYGSLSGTSMASPNVAGTLLLLQEHYRNTYGHFMRASTLKGLALHTADDAGPTGPDAKWGWGLMNAKKAAETINSNGSESLVEEMVLTEGSTITFEVESDGVNDLIASISWTDLPGTAVNNVPNSPDPVLINDLDIRVTKGNETFYPWRLTSATTNSKDGDNNVDPFERIDVANASGTYTITISHKGELATGSQPFSLIITGIEVECAAAETPENLLVSQITESTALVSWDPIVGTTYDLRYRKHDETDWTEVEDIVGASHLLTELEIDTRYEVQVRSKCSANQQSSYSDPITFDVGCIFIISEEVEPITRVTFSNIDNSSSATSTEALEDFTHIQGEVGRRGVYEISVEGNTNGPNTNYISVWIDWNHNGDFSDEGEMFEIGTITNSNGTDGQKATATIEVPRTARIGVAKMRVIKSSEAYPTDACNVYERGQAEEYTLDVTRTAGIEDQNTVNFSYYPNPTNGLLYFNSTTDIEKVTAFNLLGQQVLQTTNLKDNHIDMSHLTNGTYLFHVVFDNGSIETFKVIKN